MKRRKWVKENAESREVKMNNNVSEQGKMKLGETEKRIVWQMRAEE